MKKILCMILVASLAISSLMIAVPVDSGEAVPNISALTIRGPIRIDNNTCFNATNGVTGGNGSALNPWVIQNFEIDGTGNGNSIYIGNTTQYFVVRNCELHNASGGDGTIFRFNASLMMFNVSHGTVHNNILTSSQFGIYTYNYSNNNTISNNIAHQNTETGIMMDVGFEGNDVMNNSAYANGLHGIYMYKGYYNILRNNTVHNNGNTGIYLYNSGSNTIYNSTIHNNTAVGIHFYSLSDFNLVRYNRIAANGYGVRIFNSIWNTIYTNNFIGNTNQAYDNNISNRWHWGYPDGGNYWDDYTGIDTMNGLNQDIPGSDGIGDTPYTNIDGGAGANDSYPLMAPYDAPVPSDMIPPRAIAWGPIGNGTQASAKIFIRWNESMNWSSVENAFKYTDGTRNFTSANGTWNHDLAFNSTFTPTHPWNYETRYWVNINCTARDFAGNMFDRTGNGTGGEWPEDILTWNFTVTDEAPYVLSTIPANAQIDVDPNRPIKMVFSERMNRTSVEKGFSYTNGTHTWNVTDGVVFWNTLQTEFTFSPVVPLERNRTYMVMLNGTLARDAGGKLLDGGDFMWSFITWKEPPAPHVIDTYPPAGAFNVNVNTYINIGFDTEMSIISMGDAFSYTDGIDVWNITNGTVDWFSENTLFSFQPAERLKFSSTYTVCITSNATSIYDKPLDGNGNGIPDTNDDFVFTFTTTPEPPTVLSHYPEANMMEVPISLSAIYINFTKLMSINSVTNAVSVYPNTVFTPSFSGAGRNLTLVINGELLEGTQYRITVMGTATDLAGTKLDGNNDGWAGDKFTFSFFTAGLVEPVKPQIVNVFPANNATVPVGAFYIGVTFNVVMNKTSVQNAFKFNNASTELNGTFTWSVSGKSFRFTPTEQLAYNTTYFASIQGTAKDSNGYYLGNASSWQYITEAAAETTSYKDWIIYGTIIFLVVMIVILYMANRSLRKDLKRTRVKLKRLKREFGVEEDAEKPGAPPEELESPDDKTSDSEPSIEPEKTE
jgi:parallel beta-helix repeat protein